MQDLVVSPAADNVEQALESVLLHPLRTNHKKLLDIWLRGASFAPNRVAIHWGVAPSEYSQTLGLSHALEDAFALQAAVLVHRQKYHGHAIRPGLAQCHPELAALESKKVMRNLYQDARAITRLRIAPGRATMREVDQHLQALADDVVALLSTNARDQSHATGIVLITRMVKPLWVGDALTAI